MRRVGLCAILMALIAVPSFADPLDTRKAKRALFPIKGFSVQYPKDNGLTDLQRSYFEILVGGSQSKDQFARVAKYYGAIALTPSMFERTPAELLANPEAVPFQLAAGYHSPAAADRAALATCETIRTGAERPCVIAARILPRRYKPRDLHMSISATAAFDTYRKVKGPRAFAISPTTQAFGLAEGEIAVTEALDACNGKIPASMGRDCTIVIEDAK